MPPGYIYGSNFPTWRTVLNRNDLRGTVPNQFGKRTPSCNDLEGDQYILHLYKSSAPRLDTRRKRWQTMEKLEKCIHGVYGIRYQLCIFGSVAYGLDQDSTDLDCCLVDTENYIGGFPTEPVPSPSPYDIDGLAVNLVRAEFEIVKVISDASTPIIKFIDPTTSLPLDLNVNCPAGIYNTLFLHHHSHLSPLLFPPLAFFLKTWARKRNLTSSIDRQANLTSYALMLLLLTYLLHLNAVQDLLDRSQIPRRRGLGIVNEPLKVDVTGPRNGVGTKSQIWRQMFSSGSPQGEMGLDLEVGKDLMRVLEGFFGFVEEWEEEIKETTMSLRMKGVVPRHKGRRGKSSYMVVEDPFIRNRNTTGSLKAPTGKLFFEEARRATDILAQGGTIRDVLGVVEGSEHRVYSLGLSAIVIP